MLPTLFASLAAVLVVSLFPARAAGQCSAPNHVTWPAVNPVWDFCWRSPSSAPPLSDGDGIELTDVYYRGSKILEQAHVPVVNQKYTVGGCNCTRDWLDFEKAFDCAPSPSSGYCTGTTTPSTTVCEHPGTDAGTFTGVAVEDLGTYLRVSSQVSAGWTRFILRWEFHLDGTLQARMGFTEVNDSCLTRTHRHHAYYRFDFDVDGVAENWVDYLPPGGGPPVRVTAESAVQDSGANRSRWLIGRDGSTNRVELARTPEDGAFGDSPGKVSGDFPVADGWVLAHHPGEETDTGLGCAINLSGYLNAENVNGADVVLWVRSGSMHIGQAGGHNHLCTVNGPTVRVVNDLFADGFESGNLTAWSTSTP